MREAKFESKDINYKLMKEVTSNFGFLLQGQRMVSVFPFISICPSCVLIFCGRKCYF